MASLRYSTVSFLSDFGSSDEFVGVVKSVIRSFAPGIDIVDVTHDITAFDVRAGGLALARSAPYLNPGVVLGVVDPGVGSDRRAVAIEVGDGISMLVGPDNGLLAAAVAMVGGATRAFDITDSPARLDSPGATFDGRDLFAPVVGALCSGTDPAELGKEIEPAGLMPGVVPVSAKEGDAFVAEVLWIDRFGNAQLNIDPDDLVADGDHYRLVTPSTSRPARRVSNYREITTGEVGLIVDSAGLIALSENAVSAAENLGLTEGSQIQLEVAGAPTGATTPVELSRREA